MFYYLLTKHSKMSIKETHLFFRRIFHLYQTHPKSWISQDYKDFTHSWLMMLDLVGLGLIR